MTVFRVDNAGCWAACQGFTFPWLPLRRHCVTARPLVVFQNGDNAVYWAARQGHVDVIRFLKDQAVTMDMQNNVRFHGYVSLVTFLTRSFSTTICSKTCSWPQTEKPLWIPTISRYLNTSEKFACLRPCPHGTVVRIVSNRVVMTRVVKTLRRNNTCSRLKTSLYVFHCATLC